MRGWFACGLLLLAVAAKAQERLEAATALLRSPDWVTRHSAALLIAQELDAEQDRIRDMPLGPAADQAQRVFDEKVRRRPWYDCDRYRFRVVDALADPTQASAQKLILDLATLLGGDDSPPETDEFFLSCGPNVTVGTYRTMLLMVNVRPVALAALLADPNVRVKATILDKIGDSKNPNCRQLVAPFLGSPNPTLRAAAVGAYASVRGPGAREATLKAIRDPRSIVRRSAAAALRSWRGVEEMEAWLELLNDPQMVLRDAAVSGLWDYQDPRIGRAFIRMLEGADENTHAAIAGLRSHPTTEAVPALLRFLRSRDEGTGIALPVLGKIDSPQARGAVLDMLDDPRKEYRSYAIDAVEHISSPVVDAALVSALSDSSDQVAWAAIEMIKRRKLVSAVSALRERLRREPSEMRSIEAAIRACLGLGEKDAIPPG